MNALWNPLPGVMVGLRMVRNWSACAVFALVMVGVSGCTPASNRILALRLVDGRPTLLVAACGESELRTVSVFVDNDTDTDTSSWTITHRSGSVPSVITLLDPLPGWEIQEKSLTRLRPEVRYRVGGYGAGADAFPLTFTLARLSQLGSREVLVADPKSEWKVVSEKEFRDGAREDCG